MIVLIRTLLDIFSKYQSIPFNFLSRTNVLDWQNNAENIMHPKAADRSLSYGINGLFAFASVINISEGFITRAIPITFATMFMI